MYSLDSRWCLCRSTLYIVHSSAVWHTHLNSGMPKIIYFSQSHHNLSSNAPPLSPQCSIPQNPYLRRLACFANVTWKDYPRTNCLWYFVYALLCCSLDECYLKNTNKQFIHIGHLKIIWHHRCSKEVTLSIDAKKPNSSALSHLAFYDKYLACITLALPCCAPQLLNAASKRLTNSSHMLDKWLTVHW